MRRLVMLLTLAPGALVGFGCSSPASIEVEPETPRLSNTNRSVQLQATVKDDSGKLLRDVQVSFRSMTPTVLEVAGNGQVTPVHSGTGTVLVTAGKVKREVTVLVQLAQKIVIDPESPRLMLGVTRGFKATVLNDRDEPMLIGGKVRWTSSDPAIFTVDDQGNVKTVTEGEAKLTAYAAGISGTTTIEVRHEKLHEDGTLD